MKRVALFALCALLGGCAAQADATYSPATPQSPPPPPPPPPSSAAADDSSASSTVEVDVAPAPETEPEELVATSEPPEPVYEEQGDAPGSDVVWVGGYWQWTGSDWGWYYGGWYPAPEGRIYVEPYYEHVDGHVVYVRGYWGARGEEPRYYGGDRIVFRAAVRPEGYVRGAHVVVARSGGLPPGRRGSYGPRPAGARKRPLPRASAPRRALSHGSPNREQGHGEAAHGDQGHGEAGHTEPGHAEPGHEPEHAQPGGARPEPEAKPEEKAAPKGQPPRARPKPHRK
jgi:hypothetical protein